MTDAIIYARFSSPTQERGASLERQLEDANAYAVRNEWAVVETIADLGKSAWKGDHLASGNLGKFANRVRSGLVPRGTVVIVEKLDRLSRQEARRALRWIEEMAEAGIRFAPIDMGKVYDDASLKANLFEVFEILMRAEQANKYSQGLSERVGDAAKRRRKAAIETGTMFTTRCPLWLCVTADRKFEVIPERAAVVNLIYELSRDGLGFGAIAIRLNELGIERWGSSYRGNRAAGWEPSYVRVILTTPAVEGDFEPKNGTDGRAVGYFPRVVDAALVAEARAALTARVGTGGGAKGKKISNLFSGLIECGACGGPMTMRDKGNGCSYLQCANGGLKRGCSRGEMYRYPEFEAGALAHILELALDDSHFARPEVLATASTNLAEARKRRDDLKALARHQAKVLTRFHLDDAPEIEAEYRATRERIIEAERHVETAQRAYTAAQGTVSHAEHLKRVVSVRDALTDGTRPQERYLARVKVQAALRSVVTGGIADPDRRSIHLTLAEGLHELTLTREGEVVDWQFVAEDMEGETAAQRSYLARRRRLSPADLRSLFPKGLLAARK